MNKPNISTIASIAEVVASIAVVISLVLVVRSVDQNTAAIRSANDNVIFQFNDSQLQDVIGNPELARLLSKSYSGEELDEIEELRMDHVHYRDLAMWELALTRYSEGMVSAFQFESWDRAAKLRVLYVPEDTWTRLMTAGWSEEFVQYANAAYKEYWESQRGIKEGD